MRKIEQKIDNMQKIPKNRKKRTTATNKIKINTKRIIGRHFPLEMQNARNKDSEKKIR